MDPAVLVDGAIERRVLVVGEMPPLGRDLDVAARPPELDVICRTLKLQGFARNQKPFRGPRLWTQQWIKLRGCSSDSIDLVPSARWGLPPGEEDRFFAEGVPVEGFDWLVRPSPHHALLLLARRIAGGQVHLSDKRRKSVEHLLKKDPDAWTRATERAGAWRVSRALAALERSYRHGERISPALRVRLAAEVLGAGSREEWSRGVVRMARQSIRIRPVSIVCLSGLDGAGKSTQARSLAQTIERLGGDVTIEWMPLGHNPSLAPIRDGVKRLLSRVGHFGFSGEVAEASVIRDAPVLDAGKAFRQQSGKVTEVWTTVVAITTALHHRRVAVLHMFRGGVIIFDRYVLDAAAQMHYFYGGRRAFRFQKWLLKTISPQPLCAFFLDVPPEIVSDRKHLQYAPEQLERQYGHYKSLLDEFRVCRLQGTLPREELCESIAKEVLTAYAR